MHELPTLAFSLVLVLQLHISSTLVDRNLFLFPCLIIVKRCSSDVAIFFTDSDETVGKVPRAGETQIDSTMDSGGHGI